MKAGRCSLGRFQGSQQLECCDHLVMSALRWLETRLAVGQDSRLQVQSQVFEELHCCNLHQRSPTLETKATLTKTQAQAQFNRTVQQLLLIECKPQVRFE